MDSDVIKPLDLLTDKGNRKPTVLKNIYSPLAAATLGFVGAILTKVATRRPVFSGKFVASIW